MYKPRTPLITNTVNKMCKRVSVKPKRKLVGSEYLLWRLANTDYDAYQIVESMFRTSQKTDTQNEMMKYWREGLLLREWSVHDPTEQNTSRVYRKGVDMIEHKEPFNEIVRKNNFRMYGKGRSTHRGVARVSWRSETHGEAPNIGGMKAHRHHPGTSWAMNRRGIANAIHPDAGWGHYHTRQRDNHPDMTGFCEKKHIIDWILQNVRQDDYHNYVPKGTKINLIKQLCNEAN